MDLSGFWEAITWVEAFKESLAAKRHLQAALHVHVGLLAYLGALAAFGRPARPWRALAVVVAVQFGNELMDYLAKPGFTARDAMLDCANTLFWPFVASVALAAGLPRRYRPRVSRS